MYFSNCFELCMKIRFKLFLKPSFTFLNLCTSMGEAFIVETLNWRSLPFKLIIMVNFSSLWTFLSISFGGFRYRFTPVCTIYICIRMCIIVQYVSSSTVNFCCTHLYLCGYNIRRYVVLGSLILGRLYFCTYTSWWCWNHTNQSNLPFILMYVRMQ